MYRLIVFQILARVLTFCINLIITRSSNPEFLGNGSELSFCFWACLFLAREGFRPALLRYLENIDRSDQEGHKFINMTWISMFLGLCLVAMLIFYQSSMPMILYGLATVLELLTEPFSLILFQKEQYGSKVGIESLALVLKSGVVLIGVTCFANQLPASILFAVSQCVFAVTLLCGFLFLFIYWKG